MQILIFGRDNRYTYNNTPEADRFITRLIETVDINDGGYDIGMQVPPIIWACYQKNMKILEMLLATGRCDINAVDSVGYTALIAAAYEDWSEGMKVLLKTKKCDLSVRNRYDRTALAYARMYDSKECIQLLEAAAATNANDE